MVQRKKKRDKLIAGFLALVTAFSPVASVVPVYAAGSDDVSSSVTMDPDSIKVEEGSDGIVLENPDSDEETDRITVMDDGEGSDGITIGDDDTSSDGIDIDKSGDGIAIDNPDDGIDIGESEPDGIQIDDLDLDGIDIDVDDLDDGITIESVSDDSIVYNVDPWDGKEDDLSISDQEGKDVEHISELDIDIRSIHGLVKLYPADIDPDSDLGQVKYVRVEQSEDGYKSVVTDGNGTLVYESLLDENGGLPWSEFLSGDYTYTIEAISDEGYFVSFYRVMRNSTDEDIVTGFHSDLYDSYKWDVNVSFDQTVIVNFSSIEDFNSNSNNDNNNDDDQTSLADSSDVIGFQDTGDSDSVESVMLETEKDALGYDTIEVLDSMADDVTVPELDSSDIKDAIADPVYESYIKENLNSDYVTYDDMSVFAGMVLKQTLFDKDAVDTDKTLNDIMWSDDRTSALVAQFDTYIPVYDVDSSSDYCVAYVNTMHNDSKYWVFDSCFALNDIDGNVLDDCFYDVSTGLGYIPKKYFYDVNENDEEVLTFDKVQVQLAQFIDYHQAGYTESVVLSGISDDVLANSSDFLIGKTSVQVEAGLDIDHMEVYLNGMPSLYDYDYDASTGILTLYVSSCLVGSVYVKDTRDTLDTVLNFIFPFTVAKAKDNVKVPGGLKGIEVVGKLLVDDEDSVVVGKKVKSLGDYVHVLHCGWKEYNKVKKNKYKLAYDHAYTLTPTVVGDNGYGTTAATKLRKWADWIKGKNNTMPSANPNVYESQSATNLSARHYYLNLDSVDFKKDVGFEFESISGNKTSMIPMQCSHIYASDQLPVTGKRVKEIPIKPVCQYGHTSHSGISCSGKIGYTRSAWEISDCDVYFRIIKTYSEGGKKYAVFGCVGLQHKGQTPFGLMTFEYGSAKTKAAVTKKVDYRYDTFNWKNLDNYNIKGTLFGLYDSEEHASNATIMNKVNMTIDDLDSVGENGLLAILKVKDNDGNTNVWEVPKKSNGDLKYNKVYVVEIKAGDGFRVPVEDVSDPDSAPKYKEIQIVEGRTNDIGYTNIPLRDPGAFSMIKTLNGDQGEVGIDELKAHASEEMNGAMFTLEYCDNTPEETDDMTYYDYAYAVANYDPSDVPDEMDIPDGFTGKAKNTIVLQPITGTGKYLKDLKDVPGVVSLLEPGCIVDGNWPYLGQMGGFDEPVPVMPLGVYRLTETKAPDGYDLPENNSWLAVCIPWQNSNVITGRFMWIHEPVIGEDGSLKYSYANDMVIVESQVPVIIDNGKGTNPIKANLANMKEDPTFLNLGTFKIDKDTGKPGKPLNDVLSLEGIEFEIIYSPDNTEEMDHPFLKDADGVTPIKIKRGDTIKGVKLITDENGCADTVGINVKDGKDKGVLVPGHKYILKESKSNDSFILNKKEFPFEIPRDIPSDWRPDDGTPACLFPTKDGSVIAHKDIKSAKDGYEDYLKPESERKLDYNSILMVENESPKIGVGVQKFDIMLDSSVRDMNGIANQGNATLEGHTFVVINGTKSEVRLNDKKTLDGKGTKIKSIWEHGDHLKNPYNPTYEELYHYAEESDFQVDPDGDGYICAVLKTDKDGYAETAKDLLPLGVYWIIEVDTKITDEGYHDYLVNKLDVGHVGEYEPGGDGVDEDGNPKDAYVLKKDGEKASASNMDPDGEVFAAEFTQNLKDTEWKSIDKTHSDKKEAANKPPRGGVQFQKYNWNSDDPYATGDSDLSGAKFAIINVSDAVVQNKDGDDIPTWKGHGYNDKSDFAGLKYSAVKAALGKYKVQEVVTELVEDSRSDTGFVNIDQVCQFLKEKLLV